MQFGVSLSGMGQQPIGTDMRQSFQEIPGPVNELAPVFIAKA